MLGAAAKGDRSAVWSSTEFAGGLRAELLFGRQRDADFGLGPYFEALTTTGFSDVQLGGGAAALLPIHAYLPLTLSAGAYLGKGALYGWEPGLAGELFWGSHGYNYHSLYAMSIGLFVGGRYGLGDSRETSVLVGARIDLEILALPFVFAWEAIRGGSSR
jgi:hypothetical protein